MIHQQRPHDDDLTSLAEAAGVLRMRQEPEQSNPIKGLVVGLVFSAVLWFWLLLTVVGAVTVLRWFGVL